MTATQQAVEKFVIIDVQFTVLEMSYYFIKSFLERLNNNYLKTLS